MSGGTPRILVVRADRLGDVVLSTPVLAAVRKQYPRAHLTMMVRELVAPVIRGIPGLDDVLVYDPDGRHAGWRGWWRLMRDLRERRYKIAVSLQSQRRIAAALFFAGVRFRVGPLSKPHSWLFYNRGVWQRRSKVEMHEAEYNLALLGRLGVREQTRLGRADARWPTQLHIPSAAREWARGWLAERGWKPGDPFMIVHPGMGGSALNWPESHYIELVRQLLAEGRRVIVTGGPAEGELIERVGRETGGGAWIYGGPGTGAIDRLAALMAEARLVVAPSTGPLHVAVALGRRVVTFYPRISVQSPMRWGPFVGDPSRASILVPHESCGAEFPCRGVECRYFSCMQSLKVADALVQVRTQLHAAQVEHDAGGSP